MTKQKRRQPTAAQTVRGWFRQPGPEFYRQAAVHLYSGFTELQGCRQVLELERDHLLVDLGRRKLWLYGDGLTLETLTGRELVVRGTVFKTEFLEGGGR